ncbi:MAG TPA: S53 family peptidase [Mycobacteriales bacterium]|jgi:kumamolisin|nr:S53 family peptidase [Mycobacteriales bacterium]
MGDRRLRRGTAFGAAALLTIGGAVTGASSAQAAPQISVTVFLKAPDTTALADLAAKRGLTHAQRVAAVEKLLPTAAERDTATSDLVADGLSVTSQTAWSVTASATPGVVASRFGSRPTLPSDPTSAQRRASTGSYPQLPGDLRSVATVAYPTSTGPATFQNNASTLDGEELRDAYTSSASTAAGESPDSGKDAAGTLTIATIQLAGWNESDLTNYASETGDTSFNAANDVTTVPVDQQSVPSPSSRDDGDVEVDLDQESILATDPYAHQRPYFAPNTAAGYADALSQVLDDVLQNGDAYAGGDSAITALSVTWGECEADTGASVIKNTLEPIMASLVAAGVTVFASSGDQGVYDCDNDSTGVDYPASSPEVVGVGGTTLTSTGSPAPNDGGNWSEQAWSCTSASSCAANGGSGGGASSVFSAPSYQSAIADSPFADSTQRLVPDISADGDPATGFEIYTSDPTDSRKYGTSFAIGGTSLATPVSAALFTNALAARGATAGVGDIQDLLYEASSLDDGAFRDITIGTNGASGAASADPSVGAQSGYDTVSGLGAALWPAIAGQLGSDATDVAPTLTAAMSLTHAHSRTSPRQVTATWSADKGVGGAAVKSVAVAIVRAGTGSVVHRSTTAAAAGSYSFTGKAGATYALYAEAVDTAGTASTVQTVAAVVPLDDRQFVTHGKWQREVSSAAISGSIDVTGSPGAYAKATATGRIYYLVVEVGPNRGKLAVDRAGTRLRTIDLYSSTTHVETIPIYGSLASSLASRTFTFRYLGRKVSASSSTTIDVDALDAVV